MVHVTVRATRSPAMASGGAVVEGRGGYPPRGPHRGGRLRTGTTLGAADGGGGAAERPGGRVAAVATAISIGVATAAAAAAAAAIINVSGDGADVNVAGLTAWAAAPRRAASTTKGGESGNHCRVTAGEGVGGRSCSGGTNPARRRRLHHRRSQRPIRRRYLVSDADAGGRATIS